MNLHLLTMTYLDEPTLTRIPLGAYETLAAAKRAARRVTTGAWTKVEPKRASPGATAEWFARHPPGAGVERRAGRAARRAPADAVPRRGDAVRAVSRRGGERA